MSLMSHVNKAIQNFLFILEINLYDTDAGLPDGLLSNQPPNFCTFWKAFEPKILIYFMTIWYRYFAAILCVYICIVAIGYIIPILVNFIKKNLATLY
jgi:hypothetical protein